MIGPSLNILIERLEWKRRWPMIEKDCEKLLNTFNDWLDLSSDTGSVCSVMFSDNAKIQELNHDFRGKDSPTNVLAFPNDEQGELGDVILALEVVEQEAAEQSKPFIHHALHLVLHGLLHLMGYDHMEEKDAKEMEELETGILAQLNIANPYEWR